MITVKQLDSGYWHVRGDGPCEWSQPPHFPCDEKTLREHAFPEASDKFIREAAREWEQAEAEYDSLNDTLERLALLPMAQRQAD